MNEKDHQLIKVTREDLISYRKKNICLSVDKIDWDRIKESVKDFFSTVNQRWAVSYSLFTLSVASLISYFTAPIEYKVYILIIVGISFVSGAIVLTFAFIGRNQEKKEKKKILNEFEIIEKKSSIGQPINEDTEQILDTIYNWEAKKIEINNQGVNYKYITPKKDLFNYIEIKVKSSSKYWRAGIKMSDSENNSPVPKILTERSILFHSGVKDNKTICYLYINKEKIKYDNAIADYNKEDLITLRIERVKNKTTFFINNTVFHSTDLSLDFFQNAFPSAWGDAYEFTVIFEEVIFS